MKNKNKKNVEFLTSCVQTIAPNVFLSKVFPSPSHLYNTHIYTSVRKKLPLTSLMFYFPNPTNPKFMQ